MKLIIISAEEQVPEEAKIINQLFEAGMSCFHLRKPKQTPAEVEELIKKIVPQHRPKIALHQYHFLADKNSINRLHFTEQDRSNTKNDELQRLKKEGFILSTSVHKVQAVTEHVHFDYVLLSPVFNSISKANYPGFADASFTLQKSVNAPEVIALGGIDATNIHQLKAMNFDGAAVLGAIWQKPENAVSNFKTLQEICLKNSIPALTIPQ
ncbi:thiamine phosphate synthase [uncultured Mucilaginibacter sp.]|uniref:thiamine phosphate synthase n=1 Tax=uncultured Mucilaginibacter sp. TaxID=797541 RepID=UPI00260D550D|nr:thiamine phosphate synthase [uncultured Mucilaginibacter sp.]